MREKDITVPKGPRSITLKVDDYHVLTTRSGIRIIKVICNAEDFVALPIDANVRDPKENSETVESVLDTLMNNPEMMILKNMGLIVTCGEVEEKSNKLILHFGNEEGVLNGAHSQCGILKAKNMGLPDLIKGQFDLKIIESENLTKEDVAEIAAALNKSVQVSKTSLAEKKGKFDSLKKGLPLEYVNNIEFRGNSKENEVHMDAEELIVLLDIMNVKSYESVENSKDCHPNMNIKKKVTSFENGTNDYDFMINIVKDILDLKEYIQMRYIYLRDKKKSLQLLPVKGAKGNRAFLPFSGKKLDELCPKEIYIPVLASFRANIQLNKTTGLAEWIVTDIQKLYDNIENQLWKSTLSSFKNEDVRKVCNRLGKSREHWVNLYNIVARRVAEERVKKIDANSVQEMITKKVIESSKKKVSNKQEVATVQV